MQFHPIELKDRDLILGLQDRSQMPLSDFNFTNLWIWRFAREIAIAKIEECLIIRTTYPSKEPYYFFPLSKDALGDRVKKALESLMPLKPKFKSLTSLQAQYLKEHFGINSTPNRDRFDYVYNIQELIALSGRKYHKKKNHLNKFLSSYPSFSFEEVRETHLEEIKEIYQKWYEANLNKDRALEAEKRGIESILEDFAFLSKPEGLFALRGGLLRADGEIIAFAFGEAVSDQSVVMHIEKANTSYAGVFQAINQQCLEHLWKDYEWVNREEDLGIEGLRKAKLSYHPAHLLEKYEI